MVCTDLSSNPHRGGIILYNNNDPLADFKLKTDINKVIHEPSRLLIMAYLFVLKNADLVFLKRKVDLTWGNLSAHASKLEEAGYIKITKKFREKKPVTILEITEPGRNAFLEYKEVMKEVLR